MCLCCCVAVSPVNGAPAEALQVPDQEAQVPGDRPDASFGGSAVPADRAG